jgi:hypothetical protein
MRSPARGHSPTAPRRGSADALSAATAGPAHIDRRAEETPCPSPGTAWPPVARAGGPASDGQRQLTGGRQQSRRGGPLRTAAEFLLWWIVLTALWIVLITTVDGTELVVGAGCAAAGALAATSARRVGSR